MDSMAALRNKCYLGILLAGGIAGTCEQAWNDQGLLYNFFLGLIMVCMTSFAGGLCGFFSLNLLRLATGRPSCSGQHGSGVLMGALAGSVLGTLFSALLGAGMPTAVGCALGSFLGAFLGALPDQTLSPILELIHEREAELEPRDVRVSGRDRISSDTPWTIGCHGCKVRITDSKEEANHVQVLRLRPSEGKQVPEDAQGDGARP